MPKHTQNPYEKNFKNKPDNKGFRDGIKPPKYIKVKPEDFSLPENFGKLKAKIDIDYDYQDVGMKNVGVQGIVDDMWIRQMISRLLQAQGTYTADQINLLMGSGYGHEESCICIECITKPNPKLNENPGKDKV